ncbi:MULTISPECIES: hypothetical protein [Kitasatospora]|uniref:STAS domain-containing protein n=1 Tax=Kitasatospora setae (strain ATCC 33774 / DSM 43861 / JCM 3304 / KCC A-0304 / NBRC 14216 / KM-6054) TaxID=452652 RepID=E4N4N3_KITSK|nr:MULTISPECIES: hypothetical protein [Kitasatospora]BAJ26164.1 hypothetical protein KSE_03160 [Kitasatospora setae KM-6054]
METLELDLSPGAEARLDALLAGRAGHPVRVALLVGEVAGPGPGELRRVGGLAVLVRRAGHQVVLRGAGERWRLLLELTGLAQALPLE